MQRDHAGPFGARVEQRLIPHLALRARVREDKRGARFVDRARDRVDLTHAHMTAPRKALDRVGNDRIDDQRLRQRAMHTDARGRDRREQDFGRERQIAERRRQPPHLQAGPPMRETRERELRLCATFVAEQFVPFIDDHEPYLRQYFARIGARQDQRQTLGRRDERGRHAPILPLAFGGRRIAGAQTDAPGYGEFGGGALQRARGVGRERAHRRDPEHRQRFGMLAGRRRSASERGERAEPHRPGFASPGACVQHTARASGDVAPYLALKLERLPMARSEPCVEFVREWAARCVR